MECGVIVLDMAHLERQEEEDILRLAILINYHLSQMFKLIEHGEFNHLTIIVTLPFMWKQGSLYGKFKFFKWKIEWKQGSNSRLPTMIP